MWRPVPEAFVAEATMLATVTAPAPIRVEGAWNSTPCRWAGVDLVVRIGPTMVTIVGRDGLHVRHPRRRLGSGRLIAGTRSAARSCIC